MGEQDRVYEYLLGGLSGEELELAKKWFDIRFEYFQTRDFGKLTNETDNFGERLESLKAPSSLFLGVLKKITEKFTVKK